MFRTTFLSIFSGTWPMVLICSVIVVSMRIVWIIKEKKEIIFYKELLGLCFIVYVMCLFYVVTFQDVSWSTSNFIPFKEMFRYSIGSKLFFKNVLGNMIMFMPYGFFVSYFLKLKKPISIFLLAVLASFTIEFTQLQIGRVFDVDDILLNILGALLGFGIYIFIMKLKECLPSILKSQLIYNILIVILIIASILYLSNGKWLGVM